MVSQRAVKSLARSRGRAQVPWPRERLMPGLPGSSQVVGTLAGQSSSALGRGRGAEPCSQGGVKSLARSRGRAQVPWPRERLKLGLPASSQVVGTLAGQSPSPLAAGEAEAWSPREQSSRRDTREAELKCPWPRERLKLGLPGSSQVVGTLAGQSSSPLAAGEAEAWSPRERSSR